MMQKLIDQLKEKHIGTIKENEPLASHTTMKIGGPARIFVEPNSPESVITAVKIAKVAGYPYRVIGRGSNLLVADAGFMGVIIKLGKGLEQVSIQGNDIHVGAGHSIVTLASIAGKNGLTGLEFAAGIPGSIGGAAYMNAGAHGSDMSKVIQKVHVQFLDGEAKWLTTEEMQYSYRTSVLQKIRPGIVLECILTLSKGEPSKIREQILANKKYRKDTQPYDFPCAGSIFRNPLPLYAGKLIQDLGLRGYTLGGAKVSEMHGNFIVNNDQATAQDVLDLIAYIQGQVKEHYQVDLETEVEQLK